MTVPTSSSNTNDDDNIMSVIDSMADNTENYIADCISNVMNNIPDSLLNDISKALKKQIPQKVTKSSYFYGYIYGCPCCNNYIGKERNSTILYCNHCGQALDWGKNE